MATQQIQILHRDASSKAPCQGQESAAKSDALEVWGLDTAYDEREEYLALGADLERAWTHERASPESRKRILRAALVEIVATVQGTLILLRLHWQGGDHTELMVRKHRTGNHRWTTDAETGALIAELARLMQDRSIASLLSRLGKTTGCQSASKIDPPEWHVGGCPGSQ